MTVTSGSEPLVIDKPVATVTLVAHEKGWTVVGVSKTRTGPDGQPATFTAEIGRCEFSTPRGECSKPVCTTIHRVPEPGERAYSWAHEQKFCHNWHAERVRKLAEATARTYL